MIERKQKSQKKKDSIKRMILLVLVIVGFIILNIRITTLLLSGPLPILVIAMGLSIPVLVTLVIIVILIEKINEVRTVSSFDFRGLPIMIIEANIVNREILSALLEKTGIPIDFAESRERAISLFNENPDKYNLIFIDDMLSEFNEAAGSIRTIENDWAKKIPIIAMLANPSKENIDTCIAAGMNDHIEKPFDPDDICIMIKKRALFFHDGLDAKHDLEYGIAWNDSFKLGDENVDAQHFQIFELVSALVSACADELSTKMLKGIFDILANFTVEHFEDEEALMLRYNYPEIKKHKQLHRDFKVSVKELSAKFEKSGSSKELSENLVKVVVRWLVSHIMQEDKKIVTHIRSVTARS